MRKSRKQTGKRRQQAVLLQWDPPMVFEPKLPLGTESDKCSLRKPQLLPQCLCETHDATEGSLATWGLRGKRPRGGGGGGLLELSLLRGPIKLWKESVGESK